MGSKPSVERAQRRGEKKALREIERIRVPNDERWLLLNQLGGMGTEEEHVEKEVNHVYSANMWMTAEARAIVAEEARSYYRTMAGCNDVVEAVRHFKETQDIPVNPTNVFIAEERNALERAIRDVLHEIIVVARANKVDDSNLISST